MEAQMKKKIKRLSVFILIGFVGLFGFRLLYGYVATPGADGNEAFQYSHSEESVSSKRNYASEKLKVDKPINNQSYQVDQKYEKVASMLSQSQSFDDEEKKVREATTKYSALIQYEQSSGLPGNRRLNLAIGVPPDRFDSFVTEIKEIGKLLSIRIDKTDKTNEYKDLKAKRISLEKARDALLALKSRGGRIDESINLESKVLEIEEEVQSLGVKLGEYDQENEFCTVRFGLQEQTMGKAQVSFIHRVKVALEWTVKYYLRMLAILLVAVLITLITVVLLEKLKWLPPAIANAAQKE
jgi:hypothetical protein